MRKSIKSFLSWLLLVCMVVTMIPATAYAEEPSPDAEQGSISGSLEFIIREGDTFENTTVTYANGYQLSVMYEGIGNNVISTVNDHTELRNIPNGTEITFTLYVPNTVDENAELPTIMIGGARESIDASREFKRTFNF